MNEQTQGDTPIYDKLMADRAPRIAERIVDLPEPVVSSLGSGALQESQVTVGAQTERVREKKLLSVEGYSPSAKAVVNAINDAILDGQHAVMGRAFIDYAKDHMPYVTSHEYSRLEREVRAL